MINLNDYNLDALSNEEIEFLEFEIDQELYELYRKDFWEFCLYMDEKFFTARASVLKEVAHDLQKVYEGKLKRYYVAMPPRTGKSYIVSLFCAWTFGNDSRGSIMRNTCSSTLAQKFSNDIKTMMLSPKYQKVFKIKFVRTKTEDWMLEGAKVGTSYFCGGVCSTIIGKGATKYAILDDSVKDEEDALSPTMLKKKWGWYTSTHVSRMERGCAEIHVATRWSKDDIPGKLLTAGSFEGEGTKVKIIPAMIDGKSFCEDVKTTEEYNYIRSITPRKIWLAEYMQQPIDVEGQMFPLDELKRFRLEEIQGRTPDAVLAHCDVADEGTDYLSKPFGYVFGDKVYITDVVFTQTKIENSKRKVVVKIVKHKPDIARFESNNGGKAYAISVKESLKALGQISTLIKWKHQSQNKETRILMASPKIKKHFAFLDSDDYKEGSEYANFMKFLGSYSDCAKNEHDDAPDSLTGLWEMFEKILIAKSKGIDFIREAHLRARR